VKVRPVSTRNVSVNLSTGIRHLPFHSTMPGNPQQLIFTAFLPARQTLLDKISNETNNVMSFDLAMLKSVTHEWYVTTAPSRLTPRCLYPCLHRPVRERACVTPEGLCQYREANQYLGPGCLCPLFEWISNGLAFTEAAIYVTAAEPYKGEYVAGCAKSRCGYLGKSPSSQPPRQRECSGLVTQYR
jgi:hypothetical protein